MISFSSALLSQIKHYTIIVFVPFHTRSLNYGGIAMVIGHEITHSLDDKGTTKMHVNVFSVSFTLVVRALKSEKLTFPREV